MADFETSAALSIEVPRSELRDARREIESELGDVSVGLRADGGRGGAGGMMLQDVGRDMSTLVRSADERNDLLREIVDQLQLVGGGGGGGGGGGRAPSGSVRNILSDTGDVVKDTATAAAGGGILSRFLPGAAGTVAATAGTVAGTAAAGAAGTGGLYLALRQLAGPERVDRNTRQTEANERALTGGNPVLSATVPTGLIGLGKTIRDRLGPDPPTPSLDTNPVTGGVGGAGPPGDPFAIGTGTPSLDTNPAAPGVGGAGPPGDPFGGFDIPQRRGGTFGGRSGRRTQGSKVNVSVDVSGVAGEAVEQGVIRAVEQNRQQIAADVQANVEQKLARESGGFAVSGPGGRF